MSDYERVDHRAAERSDNCSYDCDNKLCCLWSIIGVVCGMTGGMTVGTSVSLALALLDSISTETAILVISGSTVVGGMFGPICGAVPSVASKAGCTLNCDPRV